MQKPQKAVILTGFKKFGDFNQNLTQTIIQKLNQKQIQDGAIIHTAVIQVSTQAVQEFYNQIKEVLKQYQKYSVYIIHMGIGPNKGFNIQKCAYNCMNFNIPDVKQFQPKNQKISKKCQLNQVQSTKLNVNNLIAKLQGWNVKSSSDPGRYLCNYIFYRSIENFQNNNQYKMVKGCLFVHHDAKSYNVNLHKQFMLELCKKLE